MLKRFLFAVATGATLLSGVAEAGAPSVPAEVTLAATPARWIFADKKGMTLYSYDRDITPGTSACVKDCAQKWVPLAAPENAKPVGGWSVIKRPEGGLQWAYKDKPLYRYARDAFPGSQFGERPENDLWHVAGQDIDAPGDAKVFRTPQGLVLANFDGMTLYTLASDKISNGASVKVASNAAIRPTAGLSVVKSDCTAECLVNWRPLLAPWMTSSPGGDWSIVVRADGSKQWAFKNKALYTFAGDNKPADVKGDGKRESAGIFSAVMLEPAPPFPTWVTFAATDGGEVLADPNRKTLYAFDAEQNVNRPSGGASERGCNQYCLDFYKPVLVTDNSKPVGDWTIITNVNGEKQWAYKGLLLFTYAKDMRAGEITGTKNYRVLFPIMRMGGPMQGTGGS
jgi:predicted lipoprotein with Yx(FWY)xxD motif